MRKLTLADELPLHADVASLDDFPCCINGTLILPAA